MRAMYMPSVHECACSQEEIKQYNFKKWKWQLGDQLWKCVCMCIMRGEGHVKDGLHMCPRDLIVLSAKEFSRDDLSYL